MSLTREEWLRRGVILGLIVLVCVGIVWAESKVHHEPAAKRIENCLPSDSKATI